MSRIARLSFVFWILALYAMSGCASIIGIEDLPDRVHDAALDGARPDAHMTEPNDAGPVDASKEPLDARVPPPGCETWTPKPMHFEPCAIPAPSGPLALSITLGVYTYDTDRGELRDPNNNLVPHASGQIVGDPTVRIVSVESFRVNQDVELRAVGDMPLLVVSWSEITVEGTIDVSSNATNPGAGADTGGCNAATAGGASGNGGGGGGGGGFGGNGGDGGEGSQGSGGSAGRKGTQVAVPTTVRGGCRGATGGTGEGNGSGAGGAGGGALQLTARNLINITGTLLAGGQGGGGANGNIGRRSAGGGGGSGGLLGLESPAIAISGEAMLAANGGGGGEGSDQALSEDGDNGQPSASTAAGGSGGSGDGGDGGSGGAQVNTAGLNGAEGSRLQSNGRGAGGGGGGGSAGYIIIDGTESVTAGAILSPAPVKR